MTTITVDVESVRLDDTCKSILRKFIAAGYTKAGDHEIEAADLTETDFSYLLSKGFVPNSSGDPFFPQKILSKYSTQKFVQDKTIVFTLKVDLTDSKME